MSDSRLVMVEHTIKDKAEWLKTIDKFYDMMKGDDMTIDKCINDPMWKGAKTLLTLHGAGYDFCACLGEVPNSTSLQEFQAFVDELFPMSSNKCYEVDQSFGMQKLTPRDYARDFIHLARGKEYPGFIEAPKLWFVHHKVHDFKEWDEQLNGGMSAGISKCANPSEIHQLFEDGYDAVSTMFLGDGKGDVCCLWSSTADKTQQDMQGMIDRFSKGLSTNTVQPINSKVSMGVLGLGHDQWALSAVDWAKEDSAKRAKVQGVQFNTGVAYPITQ